MLLCSLSGSHELHVNELELNRNVRSVPRHSHHFRCSGATCGSWLPLDSLVLDAGVTALPCGAYLQQEDSDIVGVSGGGQSLREGDAVLTSDQMCQSAQRVGWGGGGGATAVCTVSDPRGVHFKCLTMLLVNYNSRKLEK